jgi:hypothetical protein
MFATTAEFSTHAENQLRITNVDGVTPRSRVVASACELHEPGDQPMLGNAGITVRNVIPGDRNVQVWVFVDFPRPLPIRVTVFVDP